MSLSLSNIKWDRVISGVVITFLIAYGGVICVVSGYAAYLSFEARGAPDQVMINAFADQYAMGIGIAFIGIGAFVGGSFAGRKAGVAPFQHGLLVGLIAAFIDLALSITGGLSLGVIVSVFLAVYGGWLGGKLACPCQQGSCAVQVK